MDANLVMLLDNKILLGTITSREAEMSEAEISALLGSQNWGLQHKQIKPPD